MPFVEPNNLELWHLWLMNNSLCIHLYSGWVWGRYNKISITWLDLFYFKTLFDFHLTPKTTLCIRNITQPMSYVHGLNNRFENKDSGCHNLIALDWIWSKGGWIQLISWVMLYIAIRRKREEKKERRKERKKETYKAIRTLAHPRSHVI